MCLLRRGEVSLLLELEEQSPVLYMEQSAGCRQLRLDTTLSGGHQQHNRELIVRSFYMVPFMHIIFNFNHLF